MFSHNLYFLLFNTHKKKAACLYKKYGFERYFCIQDMSMKPTNLLTALALMCSTFVFAQKKDHTKPRLISYHISFSDYSFPKQIMDSSLNKAFQQKDWYKPGNKSFGIGLSYWKGLTSNIDFSGTVTGTFSNFPANFVKDDSIGQAKFTTQVDAFIHIRAFKESARVNPFLTAGIGAGYFPNKFALYAPLGTGLQFRFSEGTYLFLQMQWRKKLTSGINNDYLFYSIGFAQHNPFKKKKEEVTVVEPVKTVMPPDKDGDCFEDKNDLCPDLKGILNGCPDTDNDGVADKDDQCPTEKGTLNGCPDTDDDGVADKDDRCIDIAGVVRYNGCPVPDTDKDGINDEEDKCPNEAGIVLNSGCPEIKQEVKQKLEYAAKNIFFRFASDEILKASFKPLDEVIKVLQGNPELNLSIAAHADNRGTPERNMMWSERRAKAVADYFMSKGIAAGRISYKGYGDTQPIADNKTEKGRAQNRRVEMKVNY